MVLIDQKLEDRQRAGQVFGLVLTKDLKVVGAIRPAATTERERLGKLYTKAVHLGENHYAMLAAFENRIDIFRLERGKEAGP
jgi:hypothetical protein